MSGFSVGDQIKVVLTIDGGMPEAQTKVVTRPTVRERDQNSRRRGLCGQTFRSAISR